ncbi:MAG: HD-GYP domain-containing protein [Lachnospiraceae bacterium]|nr:HD-GYP domain-containing protein [Lachnospiraceae bacterium]
MAENRRILTSLAAPGMVLAAGAYTDDNKLIVPADTVLNEEIIGKIKEYRIKSIKIKKDGEEKVNNVPQTGAAEPIVNGPTYFERIQKTEEFKTFRESLVNSVDDFKKNINDIVSRQDASIVDEVLKTTSGIIETSGNSLHLLDMMQCMRSFDDLTYMHMVNVGLVSNIIGKWLKLSDEDLRLITAAGLLHDVGKLKIPNEIITKPDKLTDEEYKIIKSHPELGFEMLKDKPIDTRIKLAAYQHHERYDGSGYPLGLKGNQIDFFSCIVAVADVYDAMTSDRVYRKGICPFEVIGKFEHDSSLYNPQVLYTFTRRTVEAYVNTEVLLSNGEHARIVMINPNTASRPIVITDKGSYDLSKIPDITIAALI